MEAMEPQRIMEDSLVDRWLQHGKWNTAKMSKPATPHDKQLVIWTEALKVAMSFVNHHANDLKDEQAKLVQFKVLEILYEASEDEE